ncbi:MAG: hypothetical protein GY742_09785 [Hyphomicrobiales bacterium]|nr:hypothetical protein [Hyphomicrobiales bacterium]
MKLLDSESGNSDQMVREADRDMIAAFNAILSAEIRTPLQVRTRIRFVTEQINELSENRELIKKLTDKILTDILELQENNIPGDTDNNTNIVPIRIVDGKISRDTSGNSDIAAQKVTEEAARFKSNYLEQAIMSISDAFILYDANDNLVFFNQKHIEFFPHLEELYRSGATRKEIWRHHAEKIHETDPTMDVDAFVEKRQRLCKKPRPDSECQLIDGRWVATRERFMADGGVVSIRTDITEQKLAEMELHWML